MLVVETVMDRGGRTLHLGSAGLIITSAALVAARAGRKCIACRMNCLVTHWRGDRRRREGSRGVS